MLLLERQDPNIVTDQCINRDKHHYYLYEPVINEEP